MGRQGKCMHEAHDGETADANTRPKYLTKDSKALAALRKIVLNGLKHYISMCGSGI